MIQLLLLAVIVALAIYGLAGIAKASRGLSRSAMKQLLLWAFVVVLVILGLTGRLGWIIPLIGATFAMLLRLAPVLARFLPIFLRQREPFGSASGNRPGGSQQSKMTREEALEILGLSGNADREQIAEAHRRLIQKLHPDRGGSTYLAAKLNQARDVLLG